MQITDYLPDEDLKKKLFKKRVAIVLPSPYLKEINLSKYIDSYDVIIRVGQLKELTEEQKKYYGTRTDMVSYSFNVLQRNEEYLDYLGNIDHLICPMLTLYETEKIKHYFQRSGSDYYILDDQFAKQVNQRAGTILNSGMLTLILMRHYEPEEIFWCGGDFYNFGAYGEVYNDAYLEKSKTESLRNLNIQGTELKGGELRSDLHNQEIQIKMFHDLLQEDKSISTDGHLSERLAHYAEQKGWVKTSL